MIQHLFPKMLILIIILERKPQIQETSHKFIGIRDLGKIEDITIDTATGKIISIHVNSGFRLSGIFNLSEGIMIPWNKIVKIGSDVIIVETVHNIKMEIDNKTQEDKEKMKSYLMEVIQK